METQFSHYRRSAKIRIAIAAALSLLLHVSFVAAAKFMPARPAPMVTQDDGDSKIGDPDVAELVVPYDQPEETPPPDEPTPPPEETPEPEETPPPVENMDFAEPTPEPTPEKAKPKSTPAPKFTGPIPPNAKRGPVFVPGVPGGNPQGTKPTGTPGAPKLGWKTPHPSYPPQARAMRLTGVTSVTITTDGSGHVSNVSINQSAGPVLDSATRNYVRANWSGPPNATHTTSFDYRLQ